MWFLHEVGELVELFACVACTSWRAYSSDVFSVVEHGELSCAFQLVHQFHEFHSESEVRLVASEASHCFVPCHLLQLCRQFHSAHFFKDVACHILEEVDYIVLVYERHLAVYLCEFGLSVGSEVFVAEAFRYLEVSVESAHHEQLLQCLRALWQGVELSWVHSRGHDEVACSLRCASDEYRGLHFDEVLAVEEVSYEYGHAVAQFEVVAHAWSSEVEIAVFHSDVVSTVGIVLDCERRCCALA